jgi:predicted enzyme related to lactoylglutathione lyase
MNEMWDESVPANWTVYFMVEDVDAAAARVAELGGTVLVGPHQAGEMGRFIVVRDPQGAVFTAMQFNGPMDLPPGVN